MTDDRLLTQGLEAVTCWRCGAEVLARKSSWDQTSIQWSASALTVCRERAEDMTRTDRSDRFSGCGALRDSIREAAVSGALPVVDEVAAVD